MRSSYDVRILEFCSKIIIFGNIEIRLMQIWGNSNVWFESYDIIKIGWSGQKQPTSHFACACKGGYELFFDLIFMQSNRQRIEVFVIKFL